MVESPIRPGGLPCGHSPSHHVSTYELDDGLGRHRARQKEALTLVTIQSGERFELVIRFYALAKLDLSLEVFESVRCDVV